MKKTLFTLTLSLIIFASCSNQEKTTQVEGGTLAPVEFQAKTQEFASSPVIDVRTPEEYNRGHIPDALNINWNGDNFLEQANQLDKSEPVFVYCMSGGRSAAATAKLKEEGFTVFELDGGMLNWRNNNLPESTEKSVPKAGMTMADYEHILTTDKKVLIDFYATWCGPCKMMEPHLEEISKEMEETVKVVRIDVDANKELAGRIGITNLPTLILYENKETLWAEEGYLDKAQIMAQLQ